MSQKFILNIESERLFVRTRLKTPKFGQPIEKMFFEKARETLKLSEVLVPMFLSYLKACFRVCQEA